MTKMCILHDNQNGTTLIIGMLTLVFLSIIGVFATTSSNLETKSASTDRNYKISFYAAELALQVGEASIQTLLTRRDFNESATPGHHAQDQQVVWHDIDWQNDSQTVSDISAQFTELINPPKYTIEERLYKRDSLTTGIGASTGIYNFNILGLGQDRSKRTQNYLATIYAKRFQ